MRQFAVGSFEEQADSDMGAGLRFVLVAAATATVGLAIGWDLGGNEHPTHTLGLALVVAVVVVLWLRLHGRAAGLSTAVVGVLALQPALHGLSKLAGAGQAHSGHGPMDVLAADAPAAAMQVIVSGALIATFAILARCSGLLGPVLDQVRLLIIGPIAPAEPTTVRVRTSPLGSSLRMLVGWVVRAPRRGPPVRGLR